jgi:hypothetical protein
MSVLALVSSVNSFNLLVVVRALVFYLRLGMMLFFFFVLLILDD